MKSLLCFLLLSFPVLSQKIIEKIFSPSLNENREITIGLPANYDKNLTKKYPLLVLFDGEFLYDPFSGAISYGAYWDNMPQTIIVALNQNQKNERYDDCSIDETEGIPTKKGIQFFDFIAKDLIPYIEKKYRVAPFRIIAGLDTTAGFLNFFLFNNNSMFDAYVSLSPELAKGVESQIVNSVSNSKKTIFYYQSISSEDVKFIIEPVLKLDETLSKISKNNFTYKFDNFENTTHYSMVLFSIPNALNLIFESYKPISTTEFQQKIVVLQSGFADYLSKRYDLISNNLGLKIPIRINDFKAIEAAILKNNAYPELEKLSEIARKNYPKSMLPEYELGLMYEKMGDSKKAAQKYQQASQKEAIGNLDKDMMYAKYDQMKSLIPKK